MNIVKLACVAVLSLSMSSCVVTYHNVTNNPIGNKEGKAKSGIFAKDVDFSFMAAAKKGKIQRIGTTKFVYSTFGVETKVTGE